MGHCFLFSKDLGTCIDNPLHMHQSCMSFPAINIGNHLHMGESRWPCFPFTLIALYITSILVTLSVSEKLV